MAGAVRGGTMHIADLHDNSISLGGRDWLAIVTVTVEDDTGAPVDGAAVTGTWKRGAVGTCTTNSTGSCNVEFAARGRNDQLTATDLIHETLTYEPADNVVSTIRVTRP